MTQIRVAADNKSVSSRIIGPRLGFHRMPEIGIQAVIIGYPPRITTPASYGRIAAAQHIDSIFIALHQ